MASEKITSATVKSLARQCGFELAGVAAALPAADHGRYENWVSQGMAGSMSYLTDHRSGLRADPRQLLPSAQSILCVGKLYQTPVPLSTAWTGEELGWISRYAWGQDYHGVLRAGLEKFVRALRERYGQPFDARICVDTAPILERSYAQLAGLGWVGKNTCLINEQQGSWFFLGELLLSIPLAPDAPPPDRCGTCTRCIDACPTAAIVPQGSAWTVDARRCISYLTIEKRGPWTLDERASIGHHVFGCDICQDVCPWNRRAPSTAEPAFAPQKDRVAPPLLRLADLTPDAFRALFRETPVWRAKYSGFLRNVVTAMGNAPDEKYRPYLEKLSDWPDETVADHARWALAQLPRTLLTHS